MGAAADIVEFGHQKHQISLKKETTMTRVVQPTEDQTSDSQYDDESDSASDSEVRDVATQTDIQYINIQLAIHGGNTLFVSASSNK